MAQHLVNGIEKNKTKQNKVMWPKTKNQNHVFYASVNIFQRYIHQSLQGKPTFQKLE